MGVYNKLYFINSKMISWNNMNILKAIT